MCHERWRVDIICTSPGVFLLAHCIQYLLPFVLPFGWKNIWAGAYIPHMSLSMLQNIFSNILERREGSPGKTLAFVFVIFLRTMSIYIKETG